MFTKLRLVEFSILILWTLVMIVLSIISVLKQHEMSISISAAYGSAVVAFAVKQWSQTDEVKR
jgi:hypothetical protein